MISKLKLFISAIKAQAVDIWNRSKVFILAAGAVIVAIEFQKIKEALTAYLGKKEIQKDQKEDSGLAQKENDQNAQADALVKAAQDLPKQAPVTDVDWYKKEQ